MLVAVAGGDCGEPCAAALLQMRQQRLMTGKERDRVERLWLITDEAPLSIVLMREYEGTHFVRVRAADAQHFWPPTVQVPRVMSGSSIRWET